MSFVACPFCAAPDFDLPGLKSHLLNGDCSPFESTEGISRLFGGAAPEPAPLRAPDHRLVLPYPISANDFWRATVPKGWTRPMIHLTREAEAWKRDVAWLVAKAGIRNPIDGPVALRIVHHHRALVPRKIGEEMKIVRNGSIYDLDNVLKVTIDGLKSKTDQKTGAFEVKSALLDDSHKIVRRIEVEYGDETKDGQVVVEITKLPEVQRKLFDKPEASDGKREDGLPF